MSKQTDGDMFFLMMWIKREQEEKRAHALKMAEKHHKEDKVFVDVLADLLKHWNKLRVKEKEMIANLAKVNQEKRNLTPGQRSVITGMYLKHCA